MVGCLFCDNGLKPQFAQIGQVRLIRCTVDLPHLDNLFTKPIINQRLGLLGEAPHFLQVSISSVAKSERTLISKLTMAAYALLDQSEEGGQIQTSKPLHF